MTTDNSPVLYEEFATQDGKLIGRATLNAPKSLNALTLEMIESLRAKLVEWKSRREVVAIWLEGSGDKAFCAGGDIIKLFEAMKSNDLEYPRSFFEHEYSIDLSIHQMQKPVIVWGDGVVMGGGMGLMQGAKFRIVTERTMIAMPEITIGLYPDVGASYFLQKSPKPFGLFEALTGARLNASDALKMNFADYFVPTSQKDEIFNALLGLTYKHTNEQSMMAITDLLMNLTAAFTEQMPPSQLEIHSEWITKTFSQSKLTDIDASIRSYETQDKWLSKSLAAYKSGSPTSAALIFEQLRRSKDWSLEEAFEHELAMSANCALSGEFLEGVRALLIDKDNSPKWNKPTLAEVSDRDIADHFAMPKETKLELKWMI